MTEISIQFIHCSDLHLDKSFNYLDLQNSLKRKEDIYQNFERIVDFGLKEKPDLFLMAGDIFHTVSPSNLSRLSLVRLVRKLSDAGIKVFVIGGNHDMPKTPGMSTMAIDVLSGAGLATVFSTPEVQSQVMRVDGSTIQVSGRSYLAQFQRQNPLRGVSLKENADYNIFMVHGSLLGLDVRPTSPDVMTHNPFYAEDIPNGVDYLALGHFHNPFERDYKGCKIVNPGSLERLDWSELSDKKGFAWVEINRDSIKVEHVALPMRPMESQSLALNSSSDDLTRDILSHMTERRDETKIFKLALTGTLSREQYAKIAMNRIYDMGRNSFFDFDLVRDDLDVGGEKIFFGRVENPVEAFQKRIDGLIGKSESETERRLLADVKDAGNRFLESVKE